MPKKRKNSTEQIKRLMYYLIVENAKRASPEICEGITPYVKERNSESGYFLILAS